MLRKVAVAAASNPHVEIRQDGEKFYIKTSTSVRTTEINFHIGEEFDEETVDGRKCKVTSLLDPDGGKTDRLGFFTITMEQNQFCAPCCFELCFLYSLYFLNCIWDEAGCLHVVEG